MVCGLAKQTAEWTMCYQSFAYGNVRETTKFPKPRFFNLYPGKIKRPPEVKWDDRHSNKHLGYMALQILMVHSVDSEFSSVSLKTTDFFYNNT